MWKNAILLSFIPAFVCAGDKPVCDYKSITRNCDFFKERKDQQKIKLPDGTEYSNPMWESKQLASGSVVSVNTDPTVQGSGGYGGGSITQADMNKMLLSQAEVMDLLDGTPMSTRFKMSISQIVGNGGFLKDGDSFSLQVPWPPDKKDGSYSSISSGQLFAYLKKALVPSKFAAFSAINDRNKSGLEKVKADIEKLQQAQMADQYEKDHLHAMAQQLASDKLERRSKHIQELFKYAQGQAIEVIRRGRSDKDLTATEKALIEKVKKITLNNFDSASSTCTDDKENAYYAPRSNTVTLCSGLEDDSDADLVGTLGHELGHAIDPCLFQMPAWKIDQQKLWDFIKTYKGPDAGNLVMINAKEMYYEPNLFFEEPETIEKLVKLGILTKESGEHDYQDYPFKAEYSCLVQKDKFGETTSQGIKQTKEFWDGYLVKSDDKSKGTAIFNRYMAAMQKYPQCFFAAGQANTTQEVMADMMGGIIEEKYLMENPPKSEEEKIGAYSFLRNTCPMLQVPSSSSPNLMNAIQTGILTEKHPSSELRLDYIYLNLPGVAQIYNCKRTRPACLDHLSFTKRTTTQATSKESQQ